MKSTPEENSEETLELDNVNFIPKTYIAEYLDNNKFNIEIFHDLEYPFWKDQFKPLEFFNLLYEQYAIIYVNKNKPLAAKWFALNLGFSDHQLLFFLPKLLALLSADHNPDYGVYADPLLMLWHDVIKGKYDLLCYKYYGKYKNLPLGFKFENVIEHLKTLETTNEKIIFLTNILTDFKQNKNCLGEPDEDFAKNCELEIIKLEELYRLRAPQKVSTIINDQPQPNDIETKSENKGDNIETIIEPVATKTNSLEAEFKDFTHRHHALIFKYKAEAGYIIPNAFNGSEIEKEFGPKRKQAFYSIWDKNGKTYKEPKGEELNTIIPHLSAYPNAQKAAINDLDNIQKNNL